MIRNPESSRVVISQVIDYIKAITVDGYELLLNQTRNLSKWVMDGFVADDRFYSALRKNVRTGNIKGIIIGDDIHPNLLGLLESIQSAPHLAFHINLVRVEAFRVSGGILIHAFNVENTLEVERSVIRITFGEGHPSIESESPSKEGQGSKPKLAWSEYIDTVDEKYRALIKACRRKWEAAFGNSIHMGVVGFSGGFFVGRKRYPVLFVYNESVALFSENNRKRYGAPEDAYEAYKNALMAAPEIYDMLIGGKIRVSFQDISMESLETVFEATISFGRAWMDIIGNS